MYYLLVDPQCLLRCRFVLCFSSQVILRTLDPSSAKTLDPYSPEALARLTLTNFRIRLLKAQTCRAPLNPPAEWMSRTASALTSTSTTESPASAPYAIYTLLARGTCLCHGHAEYCVAHNSSQDTRQDSNMVSGFSSVCKCVKVKSVFSLDGVLLQSCITHMSGCWSRCKMYLQMEKSPVKGL